MLDLTVTTLVPEYPHRSHWLGGHRDEIAARGVNDMKLTRLEENSESGCGGSKRPLGLKAGREILTGYLA